ncbi:MAG TPA: penicillin-binding protein 2, partial [Syntrophomonadaceae bacterium]|nr:penicillin-binding protein 2 [Syntrophomonadaceae bacterium]
EIARQAIAMRSKTMPLKEIVRGSILDCHQVSLTDNYITKALYASPYEIIKNYPDTGINNLSKEEKFYKLALDLSQKVKILNEKELIEKLNEAWEKGNSLVRLGHSLSTGDIKKINQSNISGLAIAPLINRYEPSGFCQHILGYVKNNGDSIGVAGIEKEYDNVLGKSRTSPQLISITDAKGTAIQGLMFKIVNNAENQASVVLTIDKRIQEIVEEVMNHKINKGAIVIMDVKSKEILALASRPVFNPYNLPQALEDKDGPLTNRAMCPYHPGSLFKIFMAAAALEEKKVTIDDIFYCDGAYKFTDKLSTSCWKKEGHGDLNFTEAFAYSCNPVFIEVGLRLKKSKIEEYAEKFRLADETINGWSQTRQANSHVKINPGPAGIGNASLGQQGVMLTPINITNLIATIADNGRWGRPSMVKHIINKNGERQIIEKGPFAQVISPDTARKVRTLMEEVVISGTGRTAKLPDLKLAGKTATSQTGNYRENEEILNTWFGGYFPADNPRWALVILVEGGTSGAVDAAPLFKEIADKILNSYSAIY